MLISSLPISLSLSLSIFNLPSSHKPTFNASDVQVSAITRINKHREIHALRKTSGRIYTRVHVVITAHDDAHLPGHPVATPFSYRLLLRSMLHPSAFREYILVIPRCLFPSLAFGAALAWEMGVAMVLDPSRNIPSSARSFVRFLSAIHECPSSWYFLQSFECDIFNAKMNNYFVIFIIIDLLWETRRYSLGVSIIIYILLLFWVNV